MRLDFIIFPIIYIKERRSSFLSKQSRPLKNMQFFVAVAQSDRTACHMSSKTAVLRAINVYGRLASYRYSPGRARLGWVKIYASSYATCNITATLYRMWHYRYNTTAVCYVEGLISNWFWFSSIVSSFLRPNSILDALFHFCILFER